MQKEVINKFELQLAAFNGKQNIILVNHYVLFIRTASLPVGSG